MTNGQVSVKEHLEKLFDEFKERYESERQATLAALEEFKETLSEKDRIAAIEIERRLTSYPTIEDFNKLKERVTVEFASSVGKAKAYAIVLGVLGVTISLVVGAFAILK